MKMNLGTLERVIRMLFGSTLIVISFALLSGVWAAIALIMGGMMVLFGLIGFCPTFALFGVNTRRQQQSQ